nr:hypothetical protein [Flammeovirgaceae bacterium]
MLHCPDCYHCKIKKNGRTHYGKQNYKCKICNRQFVAQNTHRIGLDKQKQIKKALKERISLRTICRIFGVSLSWLQLFAHHIGGRGKKAAQKFWNKIPQALRSCNFET